MVNNGKNWLENGNVGRNFRTISGQCSRTNQIELHGQGFSSREISE
jgi:hypothetical protein